MHHGCVKKKIKEMVVWNGNKNEHISKKEKMKWKENEKLKDPEEGKLRRKWDP